MEQAKDFITIEQFEELCANEDPKDPKIDISQMVVRLQFLRAPGTWRVPLVKRGKDMRGRPITNYPDGYRFVLVDSRRIENHIREAVEDAYRRITGKILDVESIGVRKVEHVAEKGGNSTGAGKVKHKGEKSPCAAALRRISAFFLNAPFICGFPSLY